MSASYATAVAVSAAALTGEPASNLRALLEQTTALEKAAVERLEEHRKFLYDDIGKHARVKREIIAEIVWNERGCRPDPKVLHSPPCKQQPCEIQVDIRIGDDVPQTVRMPCDKLRKIYTDLGLDMPLHLTVFTK